MNSPLITATAIALTAIAGCKEQTVPSATVLHLDLSLAENRTVDTTRMLRLESSDSCMLFGIDRLIATDSAYIVQSRNYLRAFNRHSGAYRNNISGYMTGPEGFSDISRLWNDGDTVFIFDSNEKSVGAHLADGTFLGKTIVFENTRLHRDQPPRQFYKMPDGNIMTINGSTGGSTENNPLATLYSPGFIYRKAIPGREVKESTYFVDGIYPDIDNNRLLLWEPMRDTIFAVSPDAITPLYAIDFGKHALPGHIKDLPTLIERANAFSDKNAPELASFIRYVRPDGNDIYMSFADNRGHNYIARLSTAHKGNTIHRYASDDGRYTQGAFFCIEGDSLRMELRDNTDVTANPAIYSIAKSEMQ